MEITHIFIGKQGKYKYKIPYGAGVSLIKCWKKRKCLIEYQGEQIITMVSLLRKAPLKSHFIPKGMACGCYKGQPNPNLSTTKSRAEGTMPAFGGLIIVSGAGS